MSATPRSQTTRSLNSSPSAGSASSFRLPNGEISSGRTSLNRERNHSNQFSALQSQGPEGQEITDTINEDSVRRRYRVRNSGGFLLDTVTSAGTHIRSLRHSTYSYSSTKGKEKDASLNVGPLNGKVRRSGHRPRPSIGSSPLAIEVKDTAPEESHGLDGISADITELNYNRVHRQHHGVENNSGSGRKRDFLEPNGFGADPTQIVTLALNLSESRRRHFSNTRIPPIGPLSTKRIISSGQFSSAYPYSPILTNGRALLGQPNVQRLRSPRNFSRPESSEPLEPAPISCQPWEDRDQKRYPLVASAFNVDLGETLNFNPSDATQLRAEKARTTLELLYEYRRLMMYLPKLPVPYSSRPESSKGPKKIALDFPLSYGRTYNPLQYIRNRKVRGIVKKTFDAESEGWKNIDKVRNWVDSVASQRQDHNIQVDGYEMIPPYPSEPETTMVHDLSPTSDIRRPNGTHTAKAPLPRTDWNIAPWDLLADAHWVEQGGNRKLLEDNNGHKLYATANESGEHSSRPSHDLSRPAFRRSSSVPRSFQALVDKDESPLTVREGAVAERGRRRHQLRDSITSFQDYNSSQDRKSRWHRKIIRSPSSSSSGASSQDSLNYLSQPGTQQDSRERQDSAILERQLLDLLAKEAEQIGWKPLDSLLDPGPRPEGPREGPSLPWEGGREGDHSVTQPITADKSNLDKLQAQIVTKFQLEGRHKSLHHRQGSIEDFDSTAPSSPIDTEIVPSIAINLSPPASRSLSPKKPLPFHRFPKLDGRHGIEAVEKLDFATRNDSSRERAQEVTNQAQSPRDILSSPSERLLSPKTAEGFRKSHRRKRSVTKTKTGKEEKDADSRLRVILRSSRLADIVGNPVSRVGDILWRKESSGRFSNNPSPGSSIASGTDTDEEIFIEPSETHRLSRISTATSEADNLSRKSTNGVPPGYHALHLPSFVSPFRQNDTEDRDQRMSIDDDHIARQQVAIRERGRSRGFTRLHPPNLDMRSISPSPSASLTRFETNQTNTSLDNSQAPSAVRFDDNSDLVSNPRQGKIPMAELVTPDNKRPKFREGRRWSVSDLGLSDIQGKITKTDIMRVKAFILSSGVKANEIARRAEEIRDPPSLLLQSLRSISDRPQPRIERAQETIYAARLLTRSIEQNNARLREAADQLSGNAINGLHDRIKTIESRIESRLTPRVRTSADDADVLSIDLSTTYRLDVKQLNDNIDAIMRRRRRRFRWVRRGGYLLLEWTVLGLMWWVWLIVVIIRLVKGAVWGFYRGIRWLLWL